MKKVGRRIEFEKNNSLEISKLIKKSQNSFFCFLSIKNKIFFFLIEGKILSVNMLVHGHDTCSCFLFLFMTQHSYGFITNKFKWNVAFEKKGEKIPDRNREIKHKSWWLLHELLNKRMFLQLVQDFFVFITTATLTSFYEVSILVTVVFLCLFLYEKSLSTGDIR